MSRPVVSPVNEESYFGRDEIIVSKTDPKGRITYANDVFCRVSEMPTKDLIGEPHSLIRHPDMPRTVFKLLWQTLEKGDEIFAYVKNMSKSGKFYWVFAHVTPGYDSKGNVRGYHSNRRRPNPKAVAEIEKLYTQILKKEKSYANAKDGLEAGYRLLVETLELAGKSYSEFVWALENGDV